MATWQEWVAANLPAGTRETSGYRTPQQEAALGGPSSSYHSRGTVAAPGAIDVGGPADQLKKLFDEIKSVFAGRIKELYLNLPGGTSEDIRNNMTIGRNPELGRAQHLHIALGDYTDRLYSGPPAANIPAENRGGAALKVAPVTTGEGVQECERSWQLPQFLPFVKPTPHCWSDTIIYGASLALIVVGGLMVVKGKET